MRPADPRAPLWPLLSLLFAAAVLAAPSPARAGAIQLVSADERGVTLRVEVTGERWVESGVLGRPALEVPGFRVAGVEARPQTPYAQTLIAIPPGARVIARVLDASPEEVIERAVLPISGRSGVGPDPEGLGSMPFEEDMDAILDGPWPRELTIVGETFTLRRQRVAPLTVQPIRYDEATGRLSITRRMTLRVEFVGGAPALAAAPEDRFWEPVLQGAILNYEQGRRMRIARGGASPRAASTGGSPLDRPLPGEAGLARLPTGRLGVLGAAAFDELAPEVRIQVDTTGFYAFPFQELEARGFPPGIPVAEVSLHLHEPVEGAVHPAPPYQTVEQPIEVLDANGDGIFNGADAIHAYVQTWAERSGASVGQRRWGDAEILFATYKPGSSGLRMAMRGGWRGQAGLIPLASYPQQRGYERNFYYMSAYFIPADTSHVQVFHWTNLVTYYNRADSLALEIHDIDTTQAATLRIHWVGREAATRYLFARLTSNFGTGAARVTFLADSTNAFWSGRQPFTRTAVIPGGALSEGTGNRLGIWGKRNGGAPDPVTNAVAFAGLDRFDVTWWRRFKAIRGYLECSNQGAAGEQEILATGYSDSSRLAAYDISDPSSPQRLLGIVKEADAGGFRVRMQDSTATGATRRYLVVDAPKQLPSVRYTAVTRNGIYDHVAGDYLIVVPEAFEPAVAPLAALREGQGMTVITAPVQGLFDEFNGGRRSSYAIRRFLQYAYASWDARFAIFAGDGAEDPLNHLRTSRPDWIPTEMIAGPVPFSTGSESVFERVPSDAWYGRCMACEPDELQFSPRLPEIFLGRLPVNSLSEAQAAVAKIIGYENFAPDQLWRRNMLLLADDMYSGTSTFGGGSVASSYCRRSYENRFRLLNERIRGVILAEAGLVESDPESFDMGYWLRNEPIDVSALPDSCRPDRAATQLRTRATLTPEVFNRLNQGRLWWNYQGHSSEQEMAHESIYRNITSQDDKDRLTNDNRLFFLSSFSCHPNNFTRYFENGPLGASFGEELVTLANRGAIASFGSTGFEIIPRNGVDHLNVELARALFVDPPRDARLGEGGARPVIGEVVALTFMRWYPQALSSPFERDVGISYTLLGDPASRIWVGPPQAAVTANDIPAVDGAPIRLRTPGNALSLKAKLVSNASLASIVVVREDSTGVDTIPAARYTVTPSFPDTGAASHGGRAYEARLDTVLTAESQRFRFHTTDRYGVSRAFEAVFAFTTVLRADGQTVNDNDPVSPTAVLTMIVQSPSPIVPLNDLTLTMNGVPILFTATPDPGDPSGREWLLAWDHEPLPIDQYAVRLSAAGGASATHVFRVEVGGGELSIRNAFAFPNPFQDDAIGTNFSFTLISGAPADVLLRVFTINGKLVHERKETGLAPGYHQLGWNGLDAEGAPLANGTYVYRLLATNGTSRQMHESRLVKLRRPRRGTLESETSP
jgi:hypothetical protein